VFNTFIAVSAKLTTLFETISNGRMVIYEQGKLQLTGRYTSTLSFHWKGWGKTLKTSVKTAVTLNKRNRNWGFEEHNGIPNSKADILMLPISYALLHFLYYRPEYLPSQKHARAWSNTFYSTSFIQCEWSSLTLLSEGALTMEINVTRTSSVYRRATK